MWGPWKEHKETSQPLYDQCTLCETWENFGIRKTWLFFAKFYKEEKKKAPIFYWSIFILVWKQSDASWDKNFIPKVFWSFFDIELGAPFEEKSVQIYCQNYSKILPHKQKKEIPWSYTKKIVCWYGKIYVWKMEYSLEIE